MTPPLSPAQTPPLFDSRLTHLSVASPAAYPVSYPAPLTECSIAIPPAAITQLIESPLLSDSSHLSQWSWSQLSVNPLEDRCLTTAALPQNFDMIWPDHLYVQWHEGQWQQIPPFQERPSENQLVLYQDYLKSLYHGVPIATKEIRHLLATPCSPRNLQGINYTFDNLETLILRKCPHLIFFDLSRPKPNLMELTLDTLVLCSIFIFDSTSFPALQKLTIKDCPFFTDQHIYSILPLLHRNIRHITLENLCGLTCQGIDLLSETIEKAPNALKIESITINDPRLQANRLIHRKPGQKHLLPNEEDPFDAALFASYGRLIKAVRNNVEKKEFRIIQDTQDLQAGLALH